MAAGLENPTYQTAGKGNLKTQIMVFRLLLSV